MMFVGNARILGSDGLRCGVDRMIFQANAMIYGTDTVRLDPRALIFVSDTMMFGSDARIFRADVMRRSPDSNKSLI